MKNLRFSFVSRLATAAAFAVLVGCSTAKVQTVEDTIYFHGGKCAENACSLKKDASGNVIVTNEKGVTGYGYVRDGNKIHITGWNNLEGTLSFFDGKISAIYWYSGVTWLKE